MTSNTAWATDPQRMPWLSAVPSSPTTTATGGELAPEDETSPPGRPAPLTPLAPLVSVVPDMGASPTDATAAPAAPPTTAPSAPPPVAEPRSASPSAQPRTVSADLHDLVHQRGDRPVGGWRGAVFTATAGLCNPGLSAQEIARRRMLAQVRTQLPGWASVVVASVKGGIGKTTVAAGLGLTLAEYRGDRIVALDANPDAGTLADRLTGHSGITVRDLIKDLDTIDSWTDIAHYTSLAGRLQVVASEQDPAMSEAFNREEYDAVLEVLSRYYNVIITDSGTGMVHSAMGGALAGARTLVLAAAPTIDGASRAAKTLDWLIAHGYEDLARRAVVALSCDRSSRDVDRARIIEHFRDRCEAVVPIPADPHLAIGGLINLGALRADTRDAFLELAAHVAAQFATDVPAAAAGAPQ